MNYLLVNHVPVGKTRSPNRFLIGDLWLEDLRMQAKAWQQYGRLGLCIPCVDELDVTESGSFNLVEFEPAKEGFDIFPLPRYNSMATLIKSLPQIRHQLHRACQWSSIVQADYGGHPVALGQLAWSIAEKCNNKRIWVFDGADPFPRLERNIAEEPNYLKRSLKTKLFKQFENFCYQALTNADLVFSHNASVVKRFEKVWGDHCYSFDRSFVTEQVLITQEQLLLRQQLLMDTSQPLRLVVVGRQTAIKATDHVLHAMAKACHNGANLQLDIIGDGDELENYKQLTKELNLTERVRFIGSVPYGQPLFDILAQANVLLITNLTAEISRNVLLSLARGLALITYRNPGTDALLANDDAAILVPNGDIHALSEALLTADKNRSQLAEKIANGFMLAQTKTLEKTHYDRAQIAAACINN